MEEEKTKKMEDTIKRIDEEMKRSDDLLAQMIPPAVAEKVKSGFNPIDTCEVSYTFQSGSQHQLEYFKTAAGIRVCYYHIQRHSCLYRHLEKV